MIYKPVVIIVVVTSLENQLDAYSRKINHDVFECRPPDLAKKKYVN